MDVHSLLDRILHRVDRDAYLTPTNHVDARYQPALELLRRAISDPETDVATCRALARGLHAEGRLDDVHLHSALHVIALSPKSRDLLEAARQVAEQELAALRVGGANLEHNLASVDRHRGVMTFIQGHYEVALDYFTRAMERQRTVENLGNVLCTLIRLGEEEQALELTASIRSSFPSDFVRGLDERIAQDPDLAHLRPEVPRPVSLLSFSGCSPRSAGPTRAAAKTCPIAPIPTRSPTPRIPRGSASSTSATASDMSELQSQVRLLTADRQSPEARALYATLARYVDRRVHGVVRHAASDLLSNSEVEEVVADVLFQLVTGSLLQFRGEVLGELMAFVRTVTDRRLWRSIKRKIREKRYLEQMDSEDLRIREARLQPDQLVLIVPDLPLPEEDESYLRALLEAGSKAELARQRSLSRAAVTQRVQRIRRRIEALQPGQQLAVDAWLQQAAREVLSR